MSLFSCENSLRLMNTDYIDLYQIHWSNPAIPMEETIEALGRLKKEGKIRAVGVSNFGVGDLTEYLQKGGEAVSNQLPYSLLWRSIEFDIIPKCIDSVTTGEPVTTIVF